ncbi:hypothetical protein HanOQP8_Chr06g0225621 [Helianthus annuus]|nr:hypothetical protein HanOQP8_Chr06g0225621 [Helianthus annuus]
MSRNARHVVREKSGEDAPLWRMFHPDFKGKVVVVACKDGEEWFNLTIRDNFRVHDPAALKVELPQGKGDLGALGDPHAVGVLKQHTEKHGDKRLRKSKKPHDAVVVPHLVPEVAGISRIRLRKYNDYVVVSDTLEGLSVPGGGAAAGGSSAGSKPANDKKRKGDASAASGQKGLKLRRTRTAAILQPKPVFATPPSSPKVSDVEIKKEDRRSPSIEVVNPPSVRAEDTTKKPAAQTIDDSLDSADNLIDPYDIENRGGGGVGWGGKPKSPVSEKPKSPIAEKASVSTAAGNGVEDQPSIQPSETELEFYYRSYAIMGGLGTPYETLRARGLPRGNRINQLSSMLVGSSIIANAIMEDYESLGHKEEETARLRAEVKALVKAAREGAEQLKNDKAAFEKLKQTEAWATTADLKQVRSLAKLLSEERKGWREACARENEKLFRVLQELNNLKATNVALMKEKAVAEVATKEAEAHGAKVLEEADADCNKLNKIVEDLKVEVQNRVIILEEVTARATEAEARAREAAGARDSLTISLDQLKADRDWMRDQGIGHIVGTVLDAPENATAVNELKERAREAGFKAGYNECLSHVNPFYQSKFTDKRSGFHGIDTEALYAAVVHAYNNLSLSAIEDIEKCLEAEDYVDRLQLLYEHPEEDAGTSATKED